MFQLSKNNNDLYMIHNYIFIWLILNGLFFHKVHLDLHVKAVEEVHLDYQIIVQLSF